MATQVLFSFPPRLLLFPSNAIVDQLTRNATGGVLPLTRQLSK